MTNFKDIPYGELSDLLGCSRRTNLTITGDSGGDAYLEKHREAAYRKVVYNYLAAGDILYFNNGDPELFTIAASGLLASMTALQQRGVFKQNDRCWRHLATEPIRIISNLQRDLVKDKYRVVGGMIHDLVIQSDGEMFSDTGVVNKRWSDH